MARASPPCQASASSIWFVALISLSCGRNSSFSCVVATAGIKSPDRQIGVRIAGFVLSMFWCRRESTMNLSVDTDEVQAVELLILNDCLY